MVDAPDSPTPDLSARRLPLQNRDGSQTTPGNGIQAALGEPAKPAGPSRMAILQSYKDDTQNLYTSLRIASYSREETKPAMGALDVSGALPPRSVGNLSHLERYLLGEHRTSGVGADGRRGPVRGLRRGQGVIHLRC